MTNPVTPPADPTTTPPADPVTPPANNPGDVLPQWARDQITKANNEAAKYRVEKNDAVAAATAASQAEFETKIAAINESNAKTASDLEETRIQNIKLTAALTVGIPGESAAEFASLLKGTTQEEISTHAEKVKKLFGTQAPAQRAVDPSQGSGGEPTKQLAPGLPRLMSAYQSKTP